MAQEHNATTKPQLKCRDCTVDIDKLLQDADDAPDAAAGQAPDKPALVFDLSLMGGAPVSRPEDTDHGSDDSS